MNRTKVVLFVSGLALCGVRRTCAALPAASVPPGYEAYVPGYVEGENAASALSEGWAEPGALLPGARRLQLSVLQKGDAAAIAVAIVSGGGARAQEVLEKWRPEEAGMTPEDSGKSDAEAPPGNRGPREVAPGKRFVFGAAGSKGDGRQAPQRVFISETEVLVHAVKAAGSGRWWCVAGLAPRREAAQLRGAVAQIIQKI